MMQGDLLTTLEGHVSQHPDNTFCFFLKDGTSENIGFARLWARSSAYANLLRTSGLHRGQVLLIALKHCPDLYYAFLGALLCGSIPSFMPFPSPKQDPVRYWQSHNELFARIGAGGILTYKENAAILAENLKGRPLLVLTPDASNDQPQAFSPVRVHCDDVAFLQHSSGTTGLKKGVQLSYSAVSNQLESYRRTLSLDSSDRIATWLPLYHDMGLIACFVLPLYLGIPIASMDAFEWVARPEILFDALDSYRCTYTWLPNFAFQHLCNTLDPLRNWDLGHVKAFIDCSEPCKVETLDLFSKTFHSSGITRQQLQACYAMAETVFAVTQTPIGQNVPSLRVDRDVLQSKGLAVPSTPDGPGLELLSVGPPLPGIEVRVASSRGKFLEEGNVGELAVSGQFLFSGYFRNPQASAAALYDGWYYTEDRGFLYKGNVYILGRIKEMVILYGQNYYAHDIEFTCNQVAGVKPGRCVAFGLYNPQVGSEELIVIAETELEEPCWTDLAKRIKRALATDLNITPKDITIVSPGWLLKSTAGKINRGDNTTKYLAGRAAAIGHS